MNKKHNINIRLDKELIDKLDWFQNRYYFSSRSDTIRYLAAVGFECHNKAYKLLEEENNKH